MGFVRPYCHLSHGTIRASVLVFVHSWYHWFLLWEVIASKWRALILPNCATKQTTITEVHVACFLAVDENKCPPVCQNSMARKRQEASHIKRHYINKKRYCTTQPFHREDESQSMPDIFTRGKLHSCNLKDVASPSVTEETENYSFLKW